MMCRAPLNPCSQPLGEACRQALQGCAAQGEPESEGPTETFTRVSQDKARGAEVGIGQIKSLFEQVSAKCLDAAAKADGVAGKGGSEKATPADEKQLLEAVGEAISSCQEVESMMNSLHDLEAEMAVRRGAFAVQRSEWRRLAAGLISTSLSAIMPWVSPSSSAKKLQVCFMKPRTTKHLGFSQRSQSPSLQPWNPNHEVDS